MVFYLYQVLLHTPSYFIFDFFMEELVFLCHYQTYFYVGQKLNNYMEEITRVFLIFFFSLSSHFYGCSISYQVILPRKVKINSFHETPKNKFQSP